MGKIKFKLDIRSVGRFHPMKSDRQVPSLLSQHALPLLLPLRPLELMMKM
jgi:hypothetical protein